MIGNCVLFIAMKENTAACVHGLKERLRHVNVCAASCTDAVRPGGVYDIRRYCTLAAAVPHGNVGLILACQIDIALIE